ncbi:MAG TPA: LCP family protein [Candidatus Caccenecus avistercoris]|nr:LCP family protein [Candidatus Caccenecus avistercoris]
MKTLLNKLKKTNKIFLIICFIAFILYLISYILLIKNLMSLSGIETAIRVIAIVIFGIWLLAYFLWNLINLILKKHITIAITTAITIILAIIFSFANYYISMVYTSISNIGEKEYITYTTNLVVLNGTEINEDSILGMINNSDDIEGNKLAKELIEKEELTKNEIIEYSSYYEMISDLLNKEVDGIFLSSNYLTIFGGDFEGLENTSVAYSYSKEMENQDTTLTSNKKLDEPFTLLLMGVDSETDGLNANASFNGDTLMLITFNPHTLNATMFSIPRDTYVPIACNNNRHAKINSSAAYGTSCVIDTVEQLTDITIDYYVKINFKGVVDLVDALGGIEVDIEAPDFNYNHGVNCGGKFCEQNSDRNTSASGMIYLDPGLQTINGEAALAYARCRHLYLQSDIDRNRHQQQVVEAIAKKASSMENLTNLEDILNSITKNITTNMSTEQILSFYDVLKSMISNSLSEGSFLTIEKTYLEYYSLPVRLSNNGGFTSAIGYYPDSLAAITKLMKENLEIEPHEMVKTFDFNANEEYTSKVTGEGITTGGRLETMPTFIGASVSEVEAWANSHNITLYTEFVNETDANYNASIAPGLVANQSIANGILLNNVSSLTIYINNASTTIEEPTTPPKDENNTDKNNTNPTNPNDKNENEEQDNETNEPDDPLDVILPSDKPENNSGSSSESSESNNSNNNTTNENQSH